MFRSLLTLFILALITATLGFTHLTPEIAQYAKTAFFAFVIIFWMILVFWPLKKTK